MRALLPYILPSSSSASAVFDTNLHLLTVTLTFDDDAMMHAPPPYGASHSLMIEVIQRDRVGEVIRVVDVEATACNARRAVLEDCMAADDAGVRNVDATASQSGA